MSVIFYVILIKNEDGKTFSRRKSFRNVNAGEMSFDIILFLFFFFRIIFWTVISILLMNEKKIITSENMDIEKEKTKETVEGKMKEVRKRRR